MAINSIHFVIEVVEGIIIVALAYLLYKETKLTEEPLE